MNKKPMKGADLAKLWAKQPDFVPRVPKLLSPKLDGYRAMVYDGVVWSSNGTPIANQFTQELFKGLHHLDGEIVAGSPTAPNALSATQSALKRREGEPDVKFYVFDHFAHTNDSYEFRLERAAYAIGNLDPDRVELIPQTSITSLSDLLQWEATYLAQGYEGIMLRSPTTPYKHGRTSVLDDDLWKLKRFMDGEATVVRVEEAEENTNEARTDAFGRTKRSSVKAGKVGKGMVGTIVVQDPEWGELRLSPGTMPHSERLSLWSDGRRGRTLVGQVVHWRAFGYGVKEKPRFARYYGARFDI